MHIPSLTQRSRNTTTADSGSRRSTQVLERRRHLRRRCHLGLGRSRATDLLAQTARGLCCKDCVTMHVHSPCIRPASANTRYLQLTRLSPQRNVQSRSALVDRRGQRGSSELPLRQRTNPPHAGTDFRTDGAMCAAQSAMACALSLVWVAGEPAAGEPAAGEPAAGYIAACVLL